MKHFSFKLLLLFWMGLLTIPLSAHEDDPEKYIVLLGNQDGFDSWFSIKKPYIDLLFPYYCDDHYKDAMRNIEIGITTGKGNRKKEFLLAEIGHAIEAMTYPNTDDGYGVVEIKERFKHIPVPNKANETRKWLRGVIVRVHLSGKKAEQITGLYFRGVWDYKDNNDFATKYDKKIDKHWDLNYQAYKTFQKTSMEFDGEKIIIKGDAPAGGYMDAFVRLFYKKPGIWGFWSEEGRAFDGERCSEQRMAFSYEIPELGFSNEDGYFLDGYVWPYFSKETKTLNGSDTYKNTPYTLSQLFSAPEPEHHRLKFHILENQDYEYKNISGGWELKLDLKDKSRSVDVYRRKKSEKPENRTLIFKDAKPSNGSAIVVISDTKGIIDGVDYVYECIVREKGWTKRKFIDNLATEIIVTNSTMKGDGSIHRPFVIENMAHLNRMADMCNSRGKEIVNHWILNNDIHFGKYPLKNWEPIGSEKAPFNGVFDGNGHTITVNINSKQEYKGSLFGHVKNARIENLRVGGKIQTSAKFAAGMAGRSCDTKFKNCESCVTIESSVDGDGTHGGFVGVDHSSDNRKETVFEYCVFSGQIKGEKTHSCGGFVGWVESDCRFSECLNLGRFDLKSLQSSQPIARKKNKDKIKIQRDCFTNWRLGTDKHCTQLTDDHKNLGLLGRLNIRYFCFVPERYPMLKSFSKSVTGDNTKVHDIYLSGKSSINCENPNNYNYTFKVMRKFEEGKRYTLMLPFELFDCSEYGKFYAFDRYDRKTGRIYFKTVNKNLLEANTPYVFEPKPGFEGYITGMGMMTKTNTNYYYYKPEHTQESDKITTGDSRPNGMYGTYKSQTAPEGAYGYSAGKGGIKSGTFVKVGNNVTVPALSAFIYLRNVPAHIKSLEACFESEDGEVTAIETLTRDDNNSGIYTIDGRRHAEMRKGINIVNGKKLIIK